MESKRTASQISFHISLIHLTENTRVKLFNRHLFQDLVYVTTLTDFRKIQVRATGSVEHTRLLRLNTSYILIQADSLPFEVKINEMRYIIQEALEALNNMLMGE